MFFIFYFWSAFYAFQGLAVDLITGSPVTQEIITDSLYRFLLGHGHMWFMFRLAGYYLMLPFARCISANKTALSWFCGFWILYRFVLPFISILLPLDIFNLWLNQFDFHFMISYFGYFFLGYWLKVIDIPRKLRAVLYVMGGMATVGIFVMTIYDSRQKEALCEDWLNPSAFPPFVLAVSIFVFYKYCKSYKSEKANHIMRKLSQYSLLIYILHPFFIEKLNMLGISTRTYNPIWSIPVLTIGIAAACAGIAWIIDQIPIARKLLLK